MKKFEMFRGFGKGGVNNEAANLIVGIIIFSLIIIVIFLVIYNYLKNRYNINLSGGFDKKKHSFNSLARSIGLDPVEIKALYNFIVKFNIKYPLTCFTNSKVLDDIIKKGLMEIRLDKKLSHEEKAFNSSVLLEIKIKIERNSKENTGIRSTHLIKQNQKIVLFARSKGYFYANSQRVFNDYIVIELISKNIQKRIFAVSEFIKAYFWREEDAGYTFETHILKYGDDIRTYYINHSDKLNRSQKRKFRRIPVNINGEVHPVDVKAVDNKKTYTTIDNMTAKCNIRNLSAGGLKMTVDRLNFKENFIKISFELSRYRINIIGKIIRIHNTHDNMLEITVQFIRMLLNDRNVINEYVYNYLPGYE